MVHMWHDKTFIENPMLRSAYASFQIRQLLEEVTKCVASTWNYETDR